jgi:hypothetical protein
MRNTASPLTFASVLLAAVALGGGAMAAAGAIANDGDTPLAVTAPAAVPADFDLDTEIVVHDWVLCVSRDSATAIGQARAESVAAALAAYADLKAAKTCGQFDELRVILREPLYESGPQADRDIRVYSASVHIGDGWPNAFVVYGGLPRPE